MNIFIAGPRAIRKIPSKVETRLNSILEKNYTVLVGDANGIDKSIQSFFAKINYKNVNVFASNGKARNNILNWDVTHVEVPSKVRGFEFYAAKDKAMADKADYGLMIWNGESKGTLNNILNLVCENKKAIVYFEPRDDFAVVHTLTDIDNVLRFCNEKTKELYEQLKKNKFKSTHEKTSDEYISMIDSCKSQKK